MRRGTAAAASLAAALVTLACGPAPEPPVAGPNVLLLVVDTLRADHLGSYDPSVGFTPCLDRFAERGIVFRDTIAQAPHTLGSSPAILGSLYVSEHGYSSYELAVADEHLMLPEVLRDRGFATFAVSANPHVTARNGLAQGFDTFLEDTVWTDADARHLHEIFYGWLDDRPEGAPPFFAMLWYVDPHEPYEAPQTWEERHVAAADRALISHDTRRPFKRKPSTEAQRRVSRALYRAEVEYLDAQLCELFDALERRGLSDDTLIVFTSDHGESFYEHEDVAGHPISGHGASLYREEIAVPLIVRLPGGSLAGTVIDDRVRSIDVAPTVLTLTGAWTAAARERFHGASLIDAATGAIAPPTEPVTVSELEFLDDVGVLTKHVTAVETSAGKLVQTRAYIDRRYRTPVIQLLAPRTDTPKPPDAATERALLDALRRWRATLRPIPPRPADPGDRTGLRERLRNLGYLD